MLTLFYVYKYKYAYDIGVCVQIIYVYIKRVQQLELLLYITRGIIIIWKKPVVGFEPSSLRVELLNILYISCTMHRLFFLFFFFACVLDFFFFFLLE